jgi:hypothetical protein
MLILAQVNINQMLRLQVLWEGGIPLSGAQTTEEALAFARAVDRHLEVFLVEVLELMTIQWTSIAA